MRCTVRGGWQDPRAHWEALSPRRMAVAKSKVIAVAMVIVVGMVIVMVMGMVIL